MMSIKYISYTEQQMQGMEICGYSSYINENHWSSYEDILAATEDVSRYQLHNQVEIYPVLRKQEEKVMSKVKDQMMLEQEQEFELELSYQEWLMDQDEPIEAEIIEMEEEFTRNPSTAENRIISYKPLNNTNYDPRLGA